MLSCPISPPIVMLSYTWSYGTLLLPTPGVKQLLKTILSSSALEAYLCSPAGPQTAVQSEGVSRTSWGNEVVPLGSCCPCLTASAAGSGRCQGGQAWISLQGRRAAEEAVCCGCLSSAGKLVVVSVRCWRSSCDPGAGVAVVAPRQSASSVTLDLKRGVFGGSREAPGDVH